MRLLIVILLVAPGCKERPIENPDPGEAPIAEDAGTRGANRDGGVESKDDAAPAPTPSGDPAAELAGSWHGTLEHEQYGRVRGDVIVEASGHVSYTVSGEGVTHSGVFRVTRWDGQTLVVRDTTGKGTEYRLPGTLSGDVLTLTVEPVGQIVLKRAGASL